MGCCSRATIERPGISAMGDPYKARIRERRIPCQSTGGEGYTPYRARRFWLILDGRDVSLADMPRWPLGPALRNPTSLTSCARRPPNPIDRYQPGNPSAAAHQFHSPSLFTSSENPLHPPIACPPPSTRLIAPPTKYEFNPVTLRLAFAHL